MASEVLMTISKDEVERAWLMSEYKYAVDTQSKVVHAKREGMLQGMREGKIETAKSLKDMGVLTPDQISAATGLSLDELAKL